MPDLVITRRASDAYGNPVDLVVVPVLRDPTDTFGVRDETANAIVVEPATPLVRMSAGVYAYTLADVVSGHVYTYWLETVVNGETTRREKTYTAPGGPGYYANADDLDAWLGAGNVDIYSNVAGGRTRDDARIAESLAFADNEINQALRANGYLPPIASNHAAFPMLTKVATLLAAFRLFNSRIDRASATDDAGGPSQETIRALSWRKEAYADLNRLVLTGLAGATRYTDAPTWPTAVD